MQSLIKALKPLRKRMILQNCLNYALMGLMTGCFGGLILIVLGKFILLEDILILTLAVIGFFLLIGLICGTVLKPDTYKVAETGDSLGYKERFVTALELTGSNENNIYASLEIEDAINRAKEADFKKYKITPPRKPLILILILSLAMLAVGFTRSPFEARLNEEQRIREVAAKEQGLIEKQAEEILKDIPKSKINDVNERLELLYNQLKQAKNKGELIKSLQNAQSELKRLAKESINKDLRQLGEKLAQNALTRELGENLLKGDPNAIENQLSMFKDFLQGVSSEDLKNLAKFYKEMADEIENNSQLSQTLNELSSKLAQGGNYDSEIENLSKQLNSLATQDQELRDAINKLNESVAKSAMRQGAQSQQSNQTNQSSSETSNSQNFNSQQNSGQPGQQQGNTGQQNNNGSQSQQGTGTSTSQSAQQNTGESQPGPGRGTGHIENEEIYVRNVAGMSESEMDIYGEENEGGTRSQQETSYDGNKGGNVPLSRVINEYRNEALNFPDEAQIPAGIRNLVKEYFTNLQ